MLDSVLAPSSALRPGPRLGEVVETGIAEFIAQAVRLHDAPPLGALVRVHLDDGLAIYGIVADARTDTLDMGGRPIPRGRDGCEDADVYRTHPDLAHVLRTCFTCSVVGYRDDAGVRYHLPASPAPLHYSVTACTGGQIEEFAQTLDYFRILLAARDGPVEEVLAAHIRFAADMRETSPETPYDLCLRAGRQVAALLRDDHQRLMTILQRIRRSRPA